MAMNRDGTRFVVPALAGLGGDLVSSSGNPDRLKAGLHTGDGSWRASTVLEPRIGTMNQADSPSA